MEGKGVQDQMYEAIQIKSSSYNQFQEWIKQSKMYSQDQQYAIYKLCQAMRSVSENKIQEIISNHLQKIQDNQNFIQGIYTSQLESITEQIIQNSEFSVAIVNLKIIKGFLKDYLKMFKKIDSQFIEQKIIIKEIIELSQQYSRQMDNPNSLKQTHQPQLDLSESKQAINNVKDKDQKLIIYYKKLLHEFYEKQVHNKQDLKDELQILQDKIVFLQKRLDQDFKRQPNQQSIQKETKQNIVKRREKSLQEIFKFYCRQHVIKGRRMNFEDIEKESNTMNLGEFQKFCNDFQIPLHKLELSEIYRKMHRNNEPLIYDNFKSYLIKMFERIRDIKIEGNQKQLEVIEQQINDQENIQTELQQLEEQKIQLEKDNEQLLNQGVCIDQVYDFIEIDDYEKYIKKIKGFQIPFGCNGERLDKMTFLTSSIQSTINALGVRSSIDSNQKINKDDQREEIKRKSIKRIRQLRSMNSDQSQEKLGTVSPNRKYSLAQLRKIKNSKELYLKDSEIKDIIGIGDESQYKEPFQIQFKKKDSYAYQKNRLLQQQKQVNNQSSFKTPQKQEQGSTHSRNQSLPSIQNDYYSNQKNYQGQLIHHHNSKIMSKANQIKQVNQSMDIGRKEKSMIGQSLQNNQDRIINKQKDLSKINQKSKVESIYS